MKLRVLKLGIMVFSLSIFSQLAMAQVKPPKAQKPDDKERFVKMDVNNDKYVDLKEFKAYQLENKKDEKVKKDGKSRQNKKEMSPAERFKRQDKNSDGKLDFQEFKSKPEKIKKGRK